MKLTTCPLCGGFGEIRNKLHQKELCWSCEGHGRIVDLTKIKSYQSYKVERVDEEEEE